MTVTVADQDSAVFEGAKVYLYTADDDYAGTYGYSDETGTVSFGDADQYTEGDYKAKVAYLGYEYESAQFTLPDVTQVTVTINSAAVTVNVYYAGQTAPADTKVYLYSASDCSLSKYAYTDDNGQAQFNLPVGGEFNFRAYLFGAYHSADTSTIVSDSATNMVTIDAGGGQVNVTVQTDTAEPLTGLTVRLYTTEGSHLGLIGTTDDAGLASSTIAAGTYNIKASYLGYDFWQENVTVEDDVDTVISIVHKDVTINVLGTYQGAQTPVASSKVLLYNSDGSYVSLYAYTDETGQAAFSLPERAYMAKAYYLGAYYEIDAFDVASVTSADIVIPMARANVIVDWNGAPLSDLKVYAYTGAGGYTGIYGVTDAAGSVLFSLPVGTWLFKTNYQGYQYTVADVALTADTASDVALSTGGGTLTLTIGKDETQPLEGLSCYVYTSAGSCAGVSGTTNSAGQVSFDLAEGQYLVRVKYLGYQYETKVYDIQSATDDVLYIAHQDVTLTVNGLFDTTTTAIENAKVRLYNSADEYTSAYGYTDAQGQIVFSLPQQTYKAKVEYLYSENWSGEFSWQSIDVTIPMGEALVSVTTADQVIEGAKVKVYKGTDTYVGRYGYTDENGQITFQLPVTDEDYWAQVEYLGYTFQSDPVTLTAGEVSSLDVATGGGSFTFTLLKDAQTPITSAKCYLYDSQAEDYLGLWSYVDDNGQAKFDLVDGNFTIKSNYLGHSDFFSDSFQVPDTLSHTMTIAHNDVQIHVDGTFIDSEPIEDAKVLLRTVDDGWIGLYDYSDSEGNVVLSLPDREYRIRVTYRGYTILSDPFQSEDVTVNIPMGRVSLTVLTAGQVFEGIKVYAFTSEESSLGVYESTGDDGSVAFTLPEGDYKFMAYHQGKKFWTDDIITLTGGTTTEATIDTGGGIFTLQLNKDALQGIANTWCYAYTDTDSCTGVYGQTDDQGTVSFVLSDGNYKFKVKYQGNEYWSQDTVTVPDALSYTITLPHQRYDIYARGVGQSAQPLENIKFYAYTLEDAYTGLGGYTDAAGKIGFDLADGQYKAKYFYDSVEYWTGTLQLSGTLVNINTDGTDLLPAVQNPAAGVSGSDRIALTWEAPADTNGLTLGGYHIYRRPVCQDAFELITSTALDANATSYDDADITTSGSYAYYITPVTDTGLEGLADTIVTAGFGGSVSEENTTAVAGLVAAWDQGTATLTWTAVAGVAYQIYRGAAADSLSPLQRVADAVFADTGATVDQQWYYQVATVQTTCDPDSGQPVDMLGPLSGVVSLAPLTGSGSATTDLAINADGDYIITTAAGQAYTLEGSYSGLEGDVIVTAVLGDQTITGTGADGQFSITLDSPGDWQITITEADGWPSTTLDTDWEIDNTPPTLTVEGADTRATTESTITITGTATDDQSALAGVTITSDRYTETGFGTTIDELGNFSGQVFLKTGDNVLTITAADIHGNTTAYTITVTHEVTELPLVLITSPADGDIVTASPITVAGLVRSSLPPEQIRLVLGEQVDFPTGSDNEYTFSFDGIHLADGTNLISVSAESAYGTVTAQVTIQYITESETTQMSVPRIQVYSPLPDSYLAADDYADAAVSGIATSELGIKAVTVNGQAAITTGLGTAYVSFQSPLTITAGQSELTILVTATDLADQDGSLTYTVYPDATAPVIQLDNDTSAATTTQSPYILTGTITEAHIAGATVNNQAITLSPTGTDDTYSFNVGVPLVYGESQTIVVAARDFAGNRSSTQWSVSLSSDLTIEVVSPQDGAELQGSGDQTDVAVTVRIAGAQDDDTFNVSVNGGSAQTMTRSGDVGTLTVSVPTAQADHTLAFSVQDSNGTTLSGTESHFSLVDMDNVPLEVEQIKPANGATGVEPNDFIALYFNKAIDPALLTIDVTETAHGKTYISLANGTDITGISQINLDEVHRDRETVPGGVSHFPVNRMAAFYPERDIAYGATVYVTVKYDDVEISRTSYQVRSLPTFIEGAVQDTLRTGIKGIKVAIPSLGITTNTDNDGSFGFGFQVSAENNIPGGRYKVVANPGMNNSQFGIIEQWVNVQEGRLNSMDIILLPSLNPEIPYRRIASGGNETILADGALQLDLSDATLTFPDLRHEGDVHVQMLLREEIAHPSLTTMPPYWMFAVQPAGIEVSGTVGLQVGVASQNGTYVYVQSRGIYYILLGFDPNALMIVPVGVAQFDYENKMMKSLWPVDLQRLDYIGFAIAPGEAYPYIKQCAQGEITLQQMVTAIENLK